MAVSWSQWNKEFDFAAFGERLREEKRRWDALTPEARKKEQAIIDARWAEYEKHKKWLDWCAAKNVDPNLVK